MRPPWCGPNFVHSALAFGAHPGQDRPMWFQTRKTEMPSKSDAPPGRTERMAVPARHFVTGNPLVGPFPGMEIAMFGLGCFWGAERKFWQLPGVFTTAAGYAAGYTPNPTYK